jgi:hypothetical protein
MALSSLKKLALEKLAYYSNWKFNFQKTRVIESLRYTDEALQRYVKCPFFIRFSKGRFFVKDTNKYGLFYEEALFLNYIVDHWDFDLTQLSKYEQQDYLLAVEKLKKWDQIRKFMTDAENLIKEIKRIIYIRRNSTYPQQFFIYNFPTFEWLIVTRYNSVLRQLEPYPEWQKKFKDELEPQIKMLADVSPIPLSEYPFEVFTDIDFHKFFK